MSFYKRLVFPVLQRLDAEFAHDQAIRTLGLVQDTGLGERLLRRIAGQIPARPVKVLGLTFPNELGVAAGLDKDVRIGPALSFLGFGHIEVGTLTPRPQPGNPRPRVFRLPEDRAIINRMGFPNAGVEAAVPRLSRLSCLPGRPVIGVSLGKQKETPLEQAAEDYVTVMRAVYPYADYLAVNISSPNTPGLRELQGGRYLEHLLERLTAENRALAEKFVTIQRPLLVKIAPDLTDPELEEIVGVLLAAGVDGIIVSNTTIARPAGLVNRRREEAGGLSGRPLEARSTALIARVHHLASGKLTIIGVGGVFTADDVRAKLDAGASLVQVYTGFVYEGPGMAGKILRDLEKQGL